MKASECQARLGRNALVPTSWRIHRKAERGPTTSMQSRHITNADLAGGLSKLAPPVTQMVRAHQSIRAERRRTHSWRRHPQRASRASEDVLQRAEAAYAAGGSLKAVARQVGLGHERLSRFLRERGVVLRNHSPSSSEIRLMRAMYDQGASLERVGGKFGYTVGTVRKHLLIAGVMIRDTHGR